MPGTPLSLVLSESEIAEIADAAMADLAARLAQRAFRPLGDHGPAPAPGPVEVVDGEPLAVLHVLAHLQRSAARQIDRAAARAAEHGAGYPQLGHACNMTRQGARRRWPALVSGTAVSTPRIPANPSPDRSH